MAPTKDDYKAALDAAGVDYPSDANKAELEQAAADNNVTVDEGSSGNNPPTVTPPDATPAVGMTPAEADAKAQAEANAAGATHQPALEEALEVGYIGGKVDPIPNEAYSQETDPVSSPSALEQREAMLEAQREAANA